MNSGWTSTGAFVVQFPREADLGSRFEGRAEHVASGRAANFHSFEELRDFLTEVFRRVQGECRQANCTMPPRR